VAERLAGALTEVVDPDRVCLRVDLAGQVAADCAIDVEALSRPWADRYAALVLRDRTRPAYDLEALARQQTAAASFVRTLQGRLTACSDERARTLLTTALVYGLDALHGRGERIRVD
jgi:hypothetical protein